MGDDWKQRLRFYQELGIDTFYRRRPAPNELAALSVAGRDASSPTASGPPSGDGSAPVGPTGDLFQAITPRETLEEVRGDLGECTRCNLHRGRTTIVFGSGNPQAEVVFSPCHRQRR